MHQQISIHAPRTGSDPARGRGCHPPGRIFQSTLPARGATEGVVGLFGLEAISIHAPRTGSDTRRNHLVEEARRISIHTPRTGSDRSVRRIRRPLKHFNPRSPHGERRGLALRSVVNVRFQSTLPARGATLCSGLLCQAQGISIHAPRTGSDTPPRPRCRCCFHFNPRSPHGERRHF